MEIELYKALIQARVKEENAREVVSSLRREIKNQHALHNTQLTEAMKKEIGELRAEMRAEIAKSQTEIIKWCVGAIFASSGIALAIAKMIV